MSKPDFSGVMPTRMAEAQRRIRVIEGYLAIQQPRGDDTVAAARELGISRWTFTRLATSWRNHRDPALLVRSPTGQTRRDYGIDRQAKAITIKAIQEAGFTAELSTVVPVVERDCHAAGIKPPSRPTIYNYILAERRAGQLRFDETPCMVIGRMWFHIPLLGGTPNELPCALLAVALPERLVLAHAISPDRDSPPQINALIRDLLAKTSNGADPRNMLLDRLDAKAADEVLAQRGIKAPKAAKHSPQKILARAFGDKLGELHPIYHPIGALTKPKYVMGRHDQPLCAPAAVSVIEAAIDVSNDLREKVAPFSLGNSE
jgi:hypothetical protein